MVHTPRATTRSPSPLPLAPFLLLGLSVCLAAACDPEDPTTCSGGEAYCPGVGCVNTSNSRDHCGECGNACSGCDTCIMGECTPNCCAGQRNCGTPYELVCVDVNSSREHCGTCDNPCDERQWCFHGECTDCPEPRTVCANACVDLMDDIQHCGECNYPCTDHAFCNCGECSDDQGPPGDVCRGVDGDADADGDGDGDVDGDGDADPDADAG